MNMTTNINGSFINNGQLFSGTININNEHVKLYEASVNT